MLARVLTELQTRSDEEPHSNSVWVQAEEWVLTRKEGNVQRIWRVDPRPQDQGGNPCGEAKLIWDRSKDQPIAPKLVCPIGVNHEPALPP